MICRVHRLMTVSAMSGGEKTTFAAALMRLLKNEGHKIAPFKCGPDYIDPMLHRAACGVPSVNLDSFFCDEGELKTVFAENAAGADTAVIEDTMGCYDGLSMASAECSSYDIAARLGCPVVLLLAARGMAYTVIPVIKGILSEDKHGLIRAVILNNVSPMTFKRLKPIIERETGILAAGCIPPLKCTLKSRHLGLETPTAQTETAIAEAAEALAENVDVSALLTIARDCGTLEYSPTEITPMCSANIAVAYDDAFCFYYKDNSDILKGLGARLTCFSPLGGKRLPDGTDGIILGGGYPELYAQEFAENTEMLRDIKTKILSGMPCLAECGGFMYLHSKMEGTDGAEYKAADVIHAGAFRRDRLVRFGYINVKGVFGTIKAHEFHYWDSDENGTDCLAVKPDGKRSWECMHITDTMAVGFPHMYYRSNTEYVKRFLRKADERRRICLS